MAIEAERNFNPQERDRFLDYLERRVPEVAAWIKEKKSQIDKGFLVALYRLLPPARPSIRTGVVHEFQTEQRTVLDQIKNIPDDATGFNTLEAAFKAVGNLSLPSGAGGSDGFQGWEASASIYGETLNTIEKLFAYVMTVGRYGCRVPIELLLAALGQGISDREKLLAKLADYLQTL